LPPSNGCGGPLTPLPGGPGRAGTGRDGRADHGCRNAPHEGIATHDDATLLAQGAVCLQLRRPTRQWRAVCGRILVMMKPARATRRFLPTSPFNAPPAAPPAVQYVLQDQVTHDKYGLGRVINVEDDAAVLIDFGSRQERITTPFSQLTRL
jgi:hypothetical protein